MMVSVHAFVLFCTHKAHLETFTMFAPFQRRRSGVCFSHQSICIYSILHPPFFFVHTRYHMTHMPIAFLYFSGKFRLFPSCMHNSSIPTSIMSITKDLISLPLFDFSISTVTVNDVAKFCGRRHRHLLSVLPYIQPFWGEATQCDMVVLLRLTVCRVCTLRLTLLLFAFFSSKSIFKIYSESLSVTTISVPRRRV